MKEVVQVMLLVFIILAAIYMVKVSITGEMEARALLSTDFELFSVWLKYDGIAKGLDFSIRKYFYEAYNSCASSCSSPSRIYMKNYLKSFMVPKLEAMNESIKLGMSRIQQLGYTHYSYYISNYYPDIIMSDPILVGIDVYMDIRSPHVEIVGKRRIWVNTGLNASDLSDVVDERIRIKTTAK